MVIVLKSFKVLKDRKGVSYAVMPKIVEKWDNNKDFGFNIFSPLEWKKYLHTFKTKSGKLLPRYSAAGEPVVYKVYVFGAAKWMKDGMPEIVRQKKPGRALNVANLFPGYDKNGEARSIELMGSIE